MNRVIAGIGVSVALAAASARAAGPAPASGALVLVENGRPAADIVIAAQPPRAVKLAALELRDYLEAISGAALEIVTEPGTNVAAHVFVGRSAHTDQRGVSGNGLGEGAFRMVTGPDGLVLLGRDRDFTPPEPYARGNADIPRMLQEWDARTGAAYGNPMAGVFRRYSPAVGLWDYDGRGTLYAVYAFLYDLGVRWYMPGDLGEIVPRRKTVAAPPLDRTVTPDFAYRNLGDYSPHFDIGPRDSILWRFRIGLDPAPETVGLASWAHGLNYVHGRDETKRAHPEYYALYGGQRATNHMGAGAPCLSSPGLFTATVAYARAVFDVYGEPMVSVMPADGYATHCQCDLCKGKDTPDRGPEGQMSDYVWDFVNRVAADLYQTHPRKKVMNVAYGPYRLPPERIGRFSPNVVVGIVQGRPNFQDPAFRARMVGARDAYIEKAAPGNFMTTDHYLFSRPAGLQEGMPVYFPHAIAEDLRALKGRSFGEYIELTQGPRSAMHAPGFNHLNVYLTARWYLDAGQDIEAVLEEYVNLFYGPAAREMKAFIGDAEAHWPLLRTQLDAVDRSLALLAAARQAAPDGSVYRQRIDRLADYLRPLHELRARLAADRTGVPRFTAFTGEPGEFRVDGRLDEPFWNIGGYGWNTYAAGLAERETGRPAFSPTTFRLVWCGAELRVGIRCGDRAMAEVPAGAVAYDDPAILAGDHVELLLETQAHAYYQIAVSPAGAVFDADCKGGVNPAWTASAEIAVHRDDTFWSVELRIPTGDPIEGGLNPMTVVEGRRPSALYPWYFNLGRQRVRPAETERQAYSPTGEASLRAPRVFAELIVR